MDSLVVAATLLWLAGWGVVLGDDQRDVAYHRVCCRQDAGIAVQNVPHQSWTTTFENLVEQFDSDFCVHTFGIGSSDPDKRAGVWPYATHDGAEAFESHYSSPSSSSSKRRRGSRSSSRGRSSDVSRQSGVERSTSADMKCATVEVFFKGADSPTCELDLFTPRYMAETAMSDPETRIGTGKGSWNGKEILFYVQDKRFLANAAPGRIILSHTEKLAFPDDRRLLSDDDNCDSVISRPMIESAVKSLGTSLDPKAVVRFLEFATNSRVPISNIFLRDNERKVALTVEKLKALDFTDAINDLCRRVGRRQNSLKKCLRKTEIQDLTPKYARADIPPGAFRSATKKFEVEATKASCRQSKSSVNLAPLEDDQIQRRLIESIIPAHKSVESRICDFRREARMLDFVLMRAFLAVSGTSYAELHNRAMQRRLSSRNHWMLAACASALGPSGFRGSHMKDHFSFEIEGRSRVNFLESATLADIDSEGLGPSPTCAVLAGEQKSLGAPKPANGEIDVWIAYFTRDKNGKDKVFRSITGAGNLWWFFEFGNGDLKEILKWGAAQIGRKKRSPAEPYGINEDPFPLPDPKEV